MTHLNLSKDTQDILAFIEEYKKSVRNKPEEEDENLTDFEACRLYSKTRSMEQE